MSAASSHAAVVLAAGGSRRLGRPKQLLTRDGETLVHRAARLAHETSPQRLLVIVGAHRDAVVAALSGIACEVVFNPEWERGLAGSVHAAAAVLAGHDGAVLIVGCDQPALTHSHLQALLDGAAMAASHCAATLHDGLPGIPAVVPCALLSQASMPDNDRGLGAQLRELPHAAIFTFDAPELGFDLDTEDDVRTAIARDWLDVAATD
jgi:molybdenum cofactor cytidylyltransferase